MLRILPPIVAQQRQKTNSNGPQNGDESAARKPLTDKDILCLGHLQRTFVLLDALHDVGCGRDKAHNRELFFDDYCKLVLVHVWNPLIESIHDLQQVVGLPKVAKALGVKRFSAGSFSESVAVFEPKLLKPIVTELAGQLTPAAGDPRLSSLEHVLTLVDGTVLTALPRLAKSAVGVRPATTPAAMAGRFMAGGCILSLNCRPLRRTVWIAPGRAMPATTGRTMSCAARWKPDAAMWAMAATPIARSCVTSSRRRAPL